VHKIRDSDHHEHSTNFARGSDTGIDNILFSVNEQLKHQSRVGTQSQGYKYRSKTVLQVPHPSNNSTDLKTHQLKEMSDNAQASGEDDIRYWFRFGRRWFIRGKDISAEQEEIFPRWFRTGFRWFAAGDEIIAEEAKEAAEKDYAEASK